MATVLDWEDELKSLDEVNLCRVENALHTLGDWKFFDKEFRCLRTIRSIIQHEILQRTDYSELRQ